MLVVTVASSVRLLNSLIAPARAANVNVPLVASRIVTLLEPATHPAAVERLVHVPLTVHVDAPRRTTVAAVNTSTLPVTVTVELGAPTTRTAPRTQLLLRPIVHVIAVPGLGMSAPAPQRLVPEPVRSVTATP